MVAAAPYPPFISDSDLAEDPALVEPFRVVDLVLDPRVARSRNPRLSDGTLLAFCHTVSQSPEIRDEPI